MPKHAKSSKNLGQTYGLYKTIDAAVRHEELTWVDVHRCVQGMYRWEGEWPTDMDELLLPDDPFPDAMEWAFRPRSSDDADIVDEVVAELMQKWVSPDDLRDAEGAEQAPDPWVLVRVAYDDLYDPQKETIYQTEYYRQHPWLLAGD